MEYRTLGQTELHVSTLGLGGAGVGNPAERMTDEQGAAIVRQALDLGMTYIDTAPLYGHGRSEMRVGMALRGHARAGECVVATKIGFYPEGFDYSFDATMRSVEASLNRLGLSSVPLIQVHEITPEIRESVFAPRGALSALRRLQAEGLVDHIGVTGSHLPTVEAAIKTGEFETLLLWRHYHLLDRSGGGLLEMAAQQGMGVIVGTPFAGGMLAAADVATAHYMYQPAQPREQERTQALQVACAAHGMSLAAAALHFCLGAAGVTTVIAGAEGPEQVERNVHMAKTAVPTALLRELPHWG